MILHTQIKINTKFASGTVDYIYRNAIIACKNN